MVPSRESIWAVTLEDMIGAGLPPDEARTTHASIQRALQGLRRSDGPEAAMEAWRRLSAGILRPDHPHALHQLVYYSTYGDWDESVRGPPPYWFPSRAHSKLTNLGRIMETHGPKLLGSSYQDPITSFNLFQKFSFYHPEVYWSIVLKELSVVFQKGPKCILDISDKSNLRGVWLPGSVLNIAECCLLPLNFPKKQDNSVAVVWRDEGCDDSPVNRMSLKELREQVMMVANAIDAMFMKGDAIAIDMPMTVTAVIIYLAIILAGCVVVSIADSFAANEIATRLNVSRAKGVFTLVTLLYPSYHSIVDLSIKKKKKDIKAA